MDITLLQIILELSKRKAIIIYTDANIVLLH